MSDEFEVTGNNKAALFSLKLHRGDGMVLIAMNWKKGKPPKDFVGFAIEYKEPDGEKFFPVKNRLAFPNPDGGVNPRTLSTRLSPIQMFRWVHFPRNAELPGKFVYKAVPVFMSKTDELSYGEPQRASIELRRETYPGKLNVTFTRGFVASQAFVDRYGGKTPKETKELMKALLPAKANQGLAFIPKHPKAEEALAWMGFEARSAILEVLDEAIADKKATVGAVLYDLNEPGIVSRLVKLGKRLRVIIDDDGAHGKKGSAENAAAKRLAASAGADHVKRQHLGKLQHNKTIVVGGKGKVKAAICGSTNHSWRGFFVQNNNAIVLRGASAVKVFEAAFEAYWTAKDSVAGFSSTGSAQWNKVGLKGIDVQVGFSPRSKKNAVLATIAKDIASTTSNLFFSMAFLYQTKGPIRDAVKKIQKQNKIFSYGISDHAVKGLDVAKPNGTVTLIQPQALSKVIPEPFKSEPTGGGGTRMHHKFVVIDFDKPTARVYMGSYNFSSAADISNGENLLLIRDRRVAVSYVVEALSMFDHYSFRVTQMKARKAKKKLQLSKAPRKAGEKAWWADYYSDARKIKDRELFA